MNTDSEHSEQQMKQSRWGFRGKTVWNWLELLIVPLALAVIELWFTTQQETRQQQIENQRAEAERELAVQRAQDEALQAYLDQMRGLLLERDLRASDEDSEVRTLARARTLTVLERLDPSRKTALMQFLFEADLVEGHFLGESGDVKDPIIELSGADLRGADLSFADLFGADLSEADLSGTDLSGADLIKAYLNDVNLSGADLRGAILEGADLSDANLEGANGSNALTGAETGAEAPNEELADEAKSLEGATMPNGQKYEDWIKDR